VASFVGKLGHNQFKGINGWLSNFTKKDGLFNRKLCGKSAIVDDGMCDEWRSWLLKIAPTPSPPDVFSADETTD